MITKSFTPRQYFFIVLVLLVPALLRHVAYFNAYVSTGVYPSVSPESKAFFENGFYPGYFIEELLLSSVIGLLYFTRWEWLRVFAFGYLADPIIDITASIYTKTTGLVFLPNFWLREIILPYLLIGFLLLWSFKDVKKIWKTTYVMTSGLLFYLLFMN